MKVKLECWQTQQCSSTSDVSPISCSFDECI